ncbi:WD40-repeat-containing domain protein [Phlebopus sp. FC_14]|nr:WD40-repeat-containing domain protein [Phlebopus sp. FC_14]
MVLQETILCATTLQTPGSGPGAFVLHDLQTGTPLASFKQTSSAPHCSTFVQTADGQGGLMFAAQMDKSTLNVYNFQKDQVALKMVLPEKLTCLALDHRAGYCAGGTSQGRIYFWEVASGLLYNSWDAHYRQVNVLKFTHDGAVLISGSEDSGVCVWSVSKLVDDDLQNELPLPQFTLSDHTLPVTDIVCGIGAFPTCRVLTASVDHTVKLWDLSTRSLMTTFHFPKPISCVVWDVTERLFFASSHDGSIHQVNLFRERENKHGGQIVEATGGAGTSDVIRIDDENIGGKRLISVRRVVLHLYHPQPVTTLTISFTSSLLLVGTATGLIHVFDIASHQLLRTISTHQGMSISFLATIFKPPDLIGHLSLSLNISSVADAKDVMPVRPVAPFHRMRDAKLREAHEVTMMLPIQNERLYSSLCEYDYPEDEFQRDYAYFTGATESESSGAPLLSRVAELEAEVLQLREQLGKAKGINDAMWETVVQKVLSQGKEKQPSEGPSKGNEATPTDVEEGEGRSERNRKRARK